MADILEQYSSLSPSSDPPAIEAVLGRIISGKQAHLRPDPSPASSYPPTAGPEVFDSRTRVSLIDLLLKDIDACTRNIGSNELKISAKGSVFVVSLVLLS